MVMIEDEVPVRIINNISCQNSFIIIKNNKHVTSVAHPVTLRRHNSRVLLASSVGIGVRSFVCLHGRLLCGPWAALRIRQGLVMARPPAGNNLIKQSISCMHILLLIDLYIFISI